MLLAGALAQVGWVVARELFHYPGEFLPLGEVEGPFKDVTKRQFGEPAWLQRSVSEASGYRTNEAVMPAVW